MKHTVRGLPVGSTEMKLRLDTAIATNSACSVDFQSPFLWIILSPIVARCVALPSVGSAVGESSAVTTLRGNVVLWSLERSRPIHQCLNLMKRNTAYRSSE